MLPIKIMIEPLLKEQYGPEICWVWRSLLTSAGLAWEEVGACQTSCDILYAEKQLPGVDFKLHIKADRLKWSHKDQLRIIGFDQDGLFYSPRYTVGINQLPLWSSKNGSICCTSDIIFDYFWIVSGQQEQYFSYGKHGIYDLSEEGEWREKILLNAAASAIGKLLEEKFSTLGFGLGIPHWPGGKRAAFCATHDVDCPEAGLVLMSMVLLKKNGLRGIKQFPELITGRRSLWQFESWLETEKEFNLQSAFYFCAKKGSFIKYAGGVPDPFYDIRSEKFARLFNLLIEHGVEIGLHASYNAGMNKEMLLSEKQQLEECSGVEVKGNRHHYWHLDPADPDETLRRHEEAGFKYDLSLTHDRYAGWRRGNTRPFFPFYRKGRKEIRTLQISTGWMDDQLFGCLKDNGGKRQSIIQDLVERTLLHGGCLVVDIHDYVFDDWLFPGWTKTYLELVRKVCEDSDFWISAPAQVSDHWRKRYYEIVNRSHGLTEGMLKPA